MKYIKPYNKIGKGAYANIYKIDYQLADDKYEQRVVKKFKFFKKKCGIPVTMIKEVCNTKNMNYDGIIKYLKILMKDNEYAVVMKLFLGDMRKYMELVPFKKRIKHISIITQKLCKILYILKQNKVLHRDIKPCNILMNWTYRNIDPPDICLSDFGISQKNIYDGDWKENDLNVYTIWYRAPEIICNDNEYEYGIYNEKAEIWALGITMFDYICFDNEFKKSVTLIGEKTVGNHIKILRKLVGDDNTNYYKNGPNKIIPKHEIYIRTIILQKIGKENFKKIPKQYFNLLSKMLTINPDNRISVEDALKHKAISHHEFIPEYNYIPTLSSNELSKYLRCQTKLITPSNKKKILSWLINICCNFNQIQVSTYIIAVDIFDKIAQFINITQDDTVDDIINIIKMCMIPSLSLAIKFNEGKSFSLKLLTDELATEETEILRSMPTDILVTTEIEILKLIEYNIHNTKLYPLLNVACNKFKKTENLYECLKELPAIYTSPETVSYETVALVLQKHFDNDLVEIK